ncbi:mandelate racemase/muconate lactonizing enzyme, partial [mine drainage metagenome]
VMADEAVFSLADLSYVIYEEAADFVNIKLMKCGGITDALKIVKTAQVFRMPTMMGCMVETKLANTAALHVALAQPNFAYSDLDGFSSLKEPGVSGGLSFIKGLNYPPKEGGIGSTPLSSF